MTLNLNHSQIILGKEPKGKQAALNWRPEKHATTDQPFYEQASTVAFNSKHQT